MHNTDHYLLATSSLGCPPAGRRLSIGEPPEEARIWEALQARCHLFPQHPLVVLAPFSTGENRNWERDRYAALADALEQHCGARVLLTFRVADRAKADDVVTHARYPLARVEGTTLREYVALIRHADLVICPDTSAMHIAAATGTPYVALFGATPVQERAPLVGGGKVLFHPLPCAPCDRPTCTHTIFRACMKQITVEEALEVCRPFLEKRHA